MNFMQIKWTDPLQFPSASQSPITPRRFYNNNNNEEHFECEIGKYLGNAQGMPWERIKSIKYLQSQQEERLEKPEQQSNIKMKYQKQEKQEKPWNKFAMKFECVEENPQENCMEMQLH